MTSETQQAITLFVAASIWVMIGSVEIIRAWRVTRWRATWNMLVGIALVTVAIRQFTYGLHFAGVSGWGDHNSTRFLPPAYLLAIASVLLFWRWIHDRNDGGS